MTIRELIAKLSTFDPEMRVVVPEDWSSGFTDVSLVHACAMKIDPESRMLHSLIHSSDVEPNVVFIGTPGHGVEFYAAKPAAERSIR